MTEQLKEFKPIGMIRSIDDLGRIVLPKEYRQIMHIQTGDRFEIFSDGKGNFYLSLLKSEVVENG